ncbi:MAG: four helix bundle protein [Desulfatiglans sp.]|jgi:four helix bundle suffix protein|nr:four helix bundle protein [Desulfatiglans sp.]
MPRIKPSGGYRSTASFQTATIIYDATYWFCEKFINQFNRMTDQMIQAARSGRQNIAEGSRAAATSSQTELRLLNVARASLEELLLDFEDFLRHRRMALWVPDSAEAMAVRGVPVKYKKDQSDQTNLTGLTDQARWQLYAKWLEHDDPAIRANAIICLINQANYLLDQQISALEKSFVEEGGYSEQLASKRFAFRENKKAIQPEQADLPDSAPLCPICGKAMVVRTAKSGKNAGNRFWGCSDYPDCKGVVKL